MINAALGWTSALDERGRRHWATCEGLELGHGGIRAVAQSTGLGERTIQRGYYIACRIRSFRFTYPLAIFLAIKALPGSTGLRTKPSNAAYRESLGLSPLSSISRGIALLLTPSVSASRDPHSIKRKCWYSVASERKNSILI